mgnify:CR=1 FL=1
MKLTDKRKRRINYLIFSIMIICITPLCEKGRMLSGARTINHFAGKELVCAIDLGRDMTGSQGLETGLNYELLGRFAQDNHCDIKIVAAGRNDNYIDSLLNGKVDIVITHGKDSLTSLESDMLKTMTDCAVWAFKNTEEETAMQLDRWISHMMGSDEFSRLESKFSATYNPHKLAERGTKTGTISPYDEIIRKYAATLGWDWRMLAAVVYQESKFSINSQSHRGATGLMQVMPATGRKYGIEDLVNPENNLMAGTSHLKRLQKMFEGKGFSQDEIIRFTLAAYNAGEGRIADCRNFAQAKGVDADNWANIVNLIPQMREDSILEEESVKLGKFQGYETIAYVEGIMSLYEAFCTICPSI